MTQEMMKLESTKRIDLIGRQKEFNATVTGLHALANQGYTAAQADQRYSVTAYWLACDYTFGDIQECLEETYQRLANVVERTGQCHHAADEVKAQIDSLKALA